MDRRATAPSIAARPPLVHRECRAMERRYISGAASLAPAPLQAGGESAAAWRRVRRTPLSRRPSCAPFQHDDLAANLSQGDRSKERTALDPAERPTSEQPAFERIARRSRVGTRS